MSNAKDGDKVKVHYTGKLEDDTVFDTSRGRQPLEFTIGGGNIIPGFEQAIIGMESGATKTFSIPPADGYGDHREELIVEVQRADFPPDVVPELGQQLQMQRPDGNTLTVVVSQIEGESVTLDANHPLAGKTLVFDVELVEIA